MEIQIAKDPMSMADLAVIAEGQFGDFVKAVVDVQQGIMAVGGELHADMEALLLSQRSRQEDLWGINLYPGKPEQERIEFDSMINIRPSSGNPSRSVERLETRARIAEVVHALVRR